MGAKKWENHLDIGDYCVHSCLQFLQLPALVIFQNVQRWKFDVLRETKWPSCNNFNSNALDIFQYVSKGMEVEKGPQLMC